MNKREQTIHAILTTALRLFHERGYQATSIRRIAEEAHVSLGMVNHYFGSKEHLGAQVLYLLDSYAAAELPTRLSFDNDPILYDLVSVRVLFKFKYDRGYKEFYLDSLRSDFFFNYLFSHPPVLINALMKKYSFEANEDTILLYSKYLPYMMEKTVVLKKEQGFFPTIPQEEIPYLICQTAMNHFIPENDIRARDEDSKRIADELCQTLQVFPPDDLIASFVQRFDETHQKASSEAHDFWKQQITNQIQ